MVAQESNRVILSHEWQRPVDSSSAVPIASDLDCFAKGIPWPETAQSPAPLCVCVQSAEPCEESASRFNQPASSYAARRGPGGGTTGSPSGRCRASSRVAAAGCGRAASRTRGASCSSGCGIRRASFGRGRRVIDEGCIGGPIFRKLKVFG